MLQRTLKVTHFEEKKNSLQRDTFVATHLEKITHFEFFFFISAFNFGQIQRPLKKKFMIWSILSYFERDIVQGPVKIVKTLKYD